MRKNNIPSRVSPFSQQSRARGFTDPGVTLRRGASENVEFSLMGKRCETERKISGLTREEIVWGWFSIKKRLKNNSQLSRLDQRGTYFMKDVSSLGPPHLPPIFRLGLGSVPGASAVSTSCEIVPNFSDLLLLR